MRYVYLLVLLAGCASEPEPQYTGPSARQLAEMHCQSFGFKPSTTEYASCMQQMYLAWRAEQDTSRNLALQQLLNQQSRSAYQPMTPYEMQFTPQRITNCTADGLGGVRCTTN